GDDVPLQDVADAVCVRADAGVGRPAEDVNPFADVRNFGRAGEIRADVIAGDHVVGVAGAGDLDGGERPVAGDHVPFEGVGHAVAVGADDVLGAVAGQNDAPLRVAEPGRAGRIRPHEVAGDHVAGVEVGPRRRRDQDPVQEVAGDHVPFRGVADAVA